MADTYDDLAAHYHWLVEDGMLSGDEFVDQYRAILRELPIGASVLDCACGMGGIALALAPGLCHSGLR